MDRDEILNTFHWHRWVATQKGSVTIDVEDMDLYCRLINELIRENERLRASRYMAFPDGRLEMIPSIEFVKAETIRNMQERLDKYFVEHNEVKYGGGLIHKVINEVAKELLEGVPEVK